MDETTRAVRQFHRVFGQEVREEPEIPDMPLGERRVLRGLQLSMSKLALELHWRAEGTVDMPHGVIYLRLQLLQEELAELADALLHRDRCNTLRELTDIQYVLEGAYLAFGMARLKLAAFREVHRANLSKLGPGGRPLVNGAGRVMKGPNFLPPDMHAVLSGHRAGLPWRRVVPLALAMLAGALIGKETSMETFLGLSLGTVVGFGIGLGIGWTVLPQPKWVRSLLQLFR